jgi:hypothetical protein
MLAEAELDFLVELRGCDGGLSLLPSPPTVPKEHRFQGGLIYSPMIEIEGRVLAPRSLGGHRMRLWLSQLKSWHFGRYQPPYIGDIYDRTGELPGGGLEAMLYIPEEAWLTAVECLNTIWRRLELRGVDGDGRRMTVVDFSFSSNALPPP